MFKIGDFSRLCGVSIRMLRHYDEIGVLRPARVEPESGYRFYAVEQLTLVNRIRALREAGFSLEQTAALLRGGMPPDEILERLRGKREELVRDVRDARARLERLEARIAEFDPETALPELEVVRKRVEAVSVASARARVSSYGDSTAVLRAVLDFLRPHGIWPDFGWVFVYHGRTGHDSEVDVEAAVPLPLHTGFAPGAVPDGVRLGELPALPEAAAVVYVGDIGRVGLAYHALGRWMAANGYRPAGPSRNVALRRDPADPDASVTEVIFPVERTPQSPPRPAP